MKTNPHKLTVKYGNFFGNFTGSEFYAILTCPLMPIISQQKILRKKMVLISGRNTAIFW